MSGFEEADQLALRLAAAVAHRDGSSEYVTEATDIRQRMYTLFFNTYDQLRRAVGYLRWDEGDVGEIVSSLYAGRPNSNVKAKPAPGTPQQPNVSPTPTAPGPVETSTTPAGANKVPVGFPGGDPLMAS